MLPSCRRVIVAKASLSPTPSLTYHQLEEGQSNTHLMASVDSSGKGREGERDLPFLMLVSMVGVYAVAN